jgi:hypothetical protein
MLIVNCNSATKLRQIHNTSKYFIPKTSKIAKMSKTFLNTDGTDYTDMKKENDLQTQIFGREAQKAYAGAHFPLITNGSESRRLWAGDIYDQSHQGQHRWRR